MTLKLDISTGEESSASPLSGFIELNSLSRKAVLIIVTIKVAMNSWGSSHLWTSHAMV